MVDLVPEGYLSLKIAYERYARASFNGHEPWSVLSDQDGIATAHATVAQQCKSASNAVAVRLLNEFCQAFSGCELYAFVRQPGSSENFQIPEYAWTDSPFCERPFLVEP